MCPFQGVLQLEGSVRRTQQGKAQREGEDGKMVINRAKDISTIPLSQSDHYGWGLDSLELRTSPGVGDRLRWSAPEVWWIWMVS